MRSSLCGNTCGRTERCGNAWFWQARSTATVSLWVFGWSYVLVLALWSSNPWLQRKHRNHAEDVFLDILFWSHHAYQATNIPTTVQHLLFFSGVCSTPVWSWSVIFAPEFFAVVQYPINKYSKAPVSGKLCSSHFCICIYWVTRFGSCWQESRVFLAWLPSIFFFVLSRHVIHSGLLQSLKGCNTGSHVPGKANKCTIVQHFAPTILFIQLSLLCSSPGWSVSFLIWLTADFHAS